MAKFIEEDEGFFTSGEFFVAGEFFEDEVGGDLRAEDEGELELFEEVEDTFAGFGGEVGVVFGKFQCGADAE